MKIAALIATMIVSAIIGNLLLKLGVTGGGGGFWDKVLQVRTIAGLALFASAAMLYLAVLQKLPLNVAQSFMALQFAGVILASYFLLGEALPPLRLLGVVLIAVGVAAVGGSQ